MLQCWFGHLSFKLCYKLAILSSRTWCPFHDALLEESNFNNVRSVTFCGVTQLSPLFCVQLLLLKVESFLIFNLCWLLTFLSICFRNVDTLARKYLCGGKHWRKCLLRAFVPFNLLTTSPIVFNNSTKFVPTICWDKSYPWMSFAIALSCCLYRWYIAHTVWHNTENSTRNIKILSMLRDKDS